MSAKRVKRVLHSAGNYRDQHHLAKHFVVDALEADLWVRNGFLVAHHDRPLGPIPLMVNQSGLSFAPRSPLRLEELVSGVFRHSDLVLDIRSWFRDPVPDTARELLTIDDRSRLSITCESWSLADRLRAWIPDLMISYSLRSERQFREYVAGRIDGSIDGTAVTVRHTLLQSEVEVAALRSQAERISVWTVNDADRAIELVSWGIDEIVSDNLQVLNSI